jgi:hypothetical protein
MAQTGFTPIQIYSSSTAAAAPVAGNLTNSTLGSELAINITDGKLFYKDNANAIQVIAWKITPTSAGGTGLTAYTAGDMLYYASGTILSKLAIGAAGAYMSSTGSAPQWSAPAAITKTDDTNVTLTLGGSPSTALLNAASLTLGWTGQLGISRGGTNATATPTAGAVSYGTGTAYAFTAAGTTNQVLQSNGASAPSWTGTPTLTGTNITGIPLTGLSNIASKTILGNKTTSSGAVTALTRPETLELLQTTRQSSIFGDSGQAGVSTTTTVLTATADGLWAVTGRIMFKRNSDNPGEVVSFITAYDGATGRGVAINTATPLVGSSTQTPTLAYSSNDLQLTCPAFCYAFVIIDGLQFTSAPTTLSLNSTIFG